MPASRNRRRCRLALGVDRKSECIRWIGSVTVRVAIKCVNPRACVSRSKADKGAERSCPSRRRRRGLRRGKCRSRGRQPREPLPHAPRSKSVSGRAITRVCRQMDFWHGRVSQLVNLASKADRGILSTDRKFDRRINEEHRRWENRWLTLFDRIPRGIREATGIGSSYSFFIAQHFKIDYAPVSDLREMLDHLEEDRRVRDFKPLLNKSSERRRDKRCGWCSLDFTTPAVVSACPQCRRPIASTESVKPRRRAPARR